MTKNIIFYYFLAFIYVQCNREPTVDFFYKNGKKIIRLENKTQNYVLYTHYDSSTNKYRGFSKEENDEYLIEELNLSNSGDTILYFDGFVQKKFYSNGKVKTIYKLMPMAETIVGIYFDTAGKLSYKYGNLSFLLRKDSLNLTNDYPDWQEQMRLWEKK